MSLIFLFMSLFLAGIGLAIYPREGWWPLCRLILLVLQLITLILYFVTSRI